MSKEEQIARATQQMVEKMGTEFSYVDKIGEIGRGALLIESGRAVGSTAYKTAEDIARDDKICAGACLVASACEIVAGTSAFIKYPGSMKVYFVAKSISAGCIRFRNLCRTAQGDLKPC